jgi:hypothetical protein
MTYEIKDIVTAQVYPNLTVSEISEMLKTKDYNIYRAMSNNSLIHRRYKVSKCNDDITSLNTLPKSLLMEWDRVTGKFKRYYGNVEVNE